MAISQRYLSQSMIAFVDLLGFSARVAAIESEEDLESVEHDVLLIQRKFEFENKDQLTKESHKLMRKRVQAFSDCLVVSISTVSEYTESMGVFDVLLGEIRNFALAQAECVLNGTFLRGGVALGYFYKRKNTMISPAMINAYNLEGSMCVPMICIDDSLFEQISNHKERKFYSQDYDPVPGTFKKFHDLPNGKSHWAIDYLPIYISMIDGEISADQRDDWEAADKERRLEMMTEARDRACEQSILQHKAVIVNARQSSPSDHVRAKYEWLAEYHNDSVRRICTAPREDLLI